jgi:hypothetical protein
MHNARVCVCVCVLRSRRACWMTVPYTASVSSDKICLAHSSVYIIQIANFKHHPAPDPDLKRNNFLLVQLWL